MNCSGSVWEGGLILPYTRTLMRLRQDDAYFTEGDSLNCIRTMSGRAETLRLIEGKGII